MPANQQSVMSYAVDVDYEIMQLRGVIPNVTRSDFYELDNGNLGAIVYYCPTNHQPDFEVVIEYPPSYPDKPPNAWVISPRIDSSAPHVWKRENGDAKICFIKPGRWKSEYTSYEAAAMIKSWVYAYCEWSNTGNWGWDEVGLFGHFMPG